MNKKGSANVLVSLMIGIVIFFLAINLAYPLSQVVKESRGETQMNCSNAITYQEKANCLAVDIFLPFFIGILMGVGGFYLSWRLL
jgi:uncharacterized protein (UPF0333 family)